MLPNESYEIPLMSFGNLCLQSEKAMAPHSSTLAWKIPWMEEPGGLQSMGSWRVGHDWATSFSLFTFMHWRRKWQPTPVFLIGESQGRGSLVGCCLWGCTESDMTEATQQQQQQQQQQQLDMSREMGTSPDTCIFTTIFFHVRNLAFNSSLLIFRLPVPLCKTCI